MEDYGIVYHAKIMEVEGNIEKAKKIELDVSIFKSKLEEIAKKTEREIREYQDSPKNRVHNYFSNDLVAAIYGESLQELEKLNFKLLEIIKEYYNIFLKVQEIRKELQEKVYETNTEWKENILDLLRKIKRSSNVPYKTEEKIVNQVYELVYEGIKIECFYEQDLELLNNVKEDSVDRMYIGRLIKKDIETYNEHADKKIEVFEDIESKNLFDVKLIRTITSEKLEKEYIEQNKRKISLLKTEMQIVVSDKTKIKNEEKEKTCTEYQLELIESERKDLQKEKRKRKTILVSNLLIYGAFVCTSFYVCKNVLKETVYETTTTTYDSSKEKNPEKITKFMDSMEDTVTLTEYTPWEEPSSIIREYHRNIYYYDLSNVYYNSLQELWNGNYSGEYKYSYRNVPEISEEKPKEFYKENKVVLKQTIQNREVTDKIPLKDYGFPLVALWVGAAAIDYLFILDIELKKLQRLNERLDSNNARLKKWKENIEKAKEALEKMKESLEKDLIDITKRYEELPKSIREREELQSLMLELKK